MAVETAGQLRIFEDGPVRTVDPFRVQLLKWVGNKQRFAHEIVSYFPLSYGRYIEPFLGSGALLGTLAPKQGIASDSFRPLMEIWQTLSEKPEMLKQWYAERWHQAMSDRKVEGYDRIRASYNANPNGADLVFLCRACYGGVVRFRQYDGHMSTPCGVHSPVSPESFARRVDIWHQRTLGASFATADFEDVMASASTGDMVYCDPPYNDSQTILYGAQSFSLMRLFSAIKQCKFRGVYVALSIDGTKRSGSTICDIPIPPHLFEREVLVNCGRSMLKRFQMQGQTLESEVVADRLLLTY